MADIRIKDLATTAASTASDDFVAVDGSANGTRKLNAYSPTFGGNLTVSGTGGSASTISTIGTGTNAEQNSLLVDATTSGTPAAGYGPSIRFTRKGNDGGSSSTSGAIKSVAIAGTSGNQYNADIIIAPRLGGSLIDALTVKTDGGATIAGNLTVSGTGNSSFAGNIRLPWSTPSLLSYYDATYSLGFVFDSTTRKLVLRAQSADAAANQKGTIAFESGATPSEIARFAPSTGNLLLGTTTDGGQKLQVSGTAAISGSLTLGSGSGAIAEYLNRGTTAQSNLVQWQTAGSANWSVGSGATGTNTNLEFYNHNTASTNLLLNYSTGNFLIGGTIDGGQKLQVSGTGTFSNTTASTPTIALNTTQTSTGLSFLSAITGAPSSERNWSILTNAGAYGDFVIRVSNAQGGNPITAGTTALTLDSSQNANFAAFIYQKENQALRWTSTGASGGTIRADIYADNTGVLNLRTGSTPTSVLTLGADQNSIFGGSIKTSAPSGGTAAAWKLGTVATVSPTSPNRTIEVDIAGTIYYIHAKTTNN